MRASKCIRLLKTLNKKELKEFKQFLIGHYTGRKSEISLFTLLKNFAPNYNSDNLIMNNIMKKELKGVSRKRISNQLSYLTNYLEEYLIWNKFNSEEHYYKEKLRLALYKERGFNNWYKSALNKLIEHLETTNNDSLSRLNLIDLYHSTYFANSGNSVKSTSGEGINNLHKYLDLFFVETKLRYTCESIQYKSIYNVDSPILFLEEIKNVLKNNQLESNPINTIHILILELSETPCLGKYLQLKKLIKSEYLNPVSVDMGIYYGFLMNYISNQLKEGDTLFVDEIKDWVNFGVKTKFILQNNFLPLPLFLNFISVYCTGENYEQAELIIESYLNLLKPNEQEMAKLLGKAEINFKQKKFNTIVDSLQSIRYSNPQANLRARLIILMTLFELKKEDLLDYMHTFDVHCRRNLKAGGKNIKASLNFLSILRKLLDANLNKQELIEDLERKKYIFFKSWLMEKIIV